MKVSSPRGNISSSVSVEQRVCQRYPSTPTKVQWSCFSAKVVYYKPRFFFVFYRNRGKTPKSLDFSLPLRVHEHVAASRLSVCSGKHRSTTVSATKRYLIWIHYTHVTNVKHPRRTGNETRLRVRGPAVSSTVNQPSRRTKTTAAAAASLDAATRVMGRRTSTRQEGGPWTGVRAMLV